jgi:hypothetical protein
MTKVAMNTFYQKLIALAGAQTPRAGWLNAERCTVPEIIDLVLAKTSPKRSFSMTEYSVLGLFSRKRGSINSGTGLLDYGNFNIK